MAKRLVALCAMLLTTSLIYLQNVDAETFSTLKASVPLELVINQSGEKTEVMFVGLADQIPAGFKWAFVMPKQFAVAYDPEDPKKAPVLFDLKKAILKLVANDPEFAQRAGITPEDLANAGITEQEMAVAQAEAIDGDDEVAQVAQAIKFVVDAIADDGAGKGAMYFVDGGGDLMKGCGKMTLGATILTKKAIGAICGYARNLWNAPEAQ